MRRPSEAQLARLSGAPTHWRPMPVLLDSRPLAVLKAKKWVEIKTEDHTPDDLKGSPVRFIKEFWRITVEGLKVLQEFDE